MRTALLSSLALRLDASLILDDLGFAPDAWQRQVLRSEAERLLMCVHRQGGKSTATAGLAIGTALHQPESLILLVSASLRQSGELFRKVTDAYRQLGEPIPAVEDNSVTLALANGSRIVSLPDSPTTIRGYSGPRLVIVDEAAMTSDATIYALAPMLAVSRGRFVLLSTPLGQRGFFYEAWQDTAADWERIRFTAEENMRIDRAWLAEQRRIMGPRWYNQEFMCSFEETTGQVFSSESVLAAFDSDRPALFGGRLG
jgi:hypothetical protein